MFGTGLHITSPRGGKAAGATAAPANIVAPLLSGGTVQGQTVAVDNGTWNQPVTSYTYQWKNNGVAITGATSSTYQLQASDTGATILCTVTATNGFGSGSANSNSIVPSGAAGTTSLDFSQAADSQYVPIV